MNKKLIIFIIIGLIILLGLGGLLFVSVKKQQASQATVAGPQIKKVLDEQVLSAVASLDKNSLWYFNSEGRLFRVNIDGSGLSEFPLPALSSGNFRQALWPKDGHDFIAISGTGTEETKSFYDSVQKIYINLPLQIQSLDWLPDAKRVVYIWQSADKLKQQLVQASADGSGFKAIKDVFWPDLIVKPGPDGNTVLLYRSKIEGSVNKIYSAKLDTGEIGTVIDSGKNTAATWLPAGSRFVFSQSSITAYPKLFLYDLTTKQAVDLNLNTLLDKIAFDPEGKTLYAAVPKKDNLGDAFVKIDLSSFKQETILDPDQAVRAKNLLLIGQTLYFVNTTDGKFYSLSQ